MPAWPSNSAPASRLSPQSGGEIAATLQPPRRRFTALDSWRGLAALGVAYHHIKGDYWFLDNVVHTRLGLAVDFFFVLSGFVIAASYGERLQRGFSTLKFMFLRFARVWPLHIAVLALFVVLELVFAALGTLDFFNARTPFGPERALADLPAVALLLQEYVLRDAHVWNIAAWSISVEVGLYLLAALLLRIAGRWGTVIFLVSALVAGWLLLGRVPGNWNDILRGICGFGIGMALFELWQRISGWHPSTLLASLAEIVLAAAIVAAVAMVSSRIGADLVFAAGILVFAFERGLVSRLLLRPVFVWLGTLSYSIYMIHGMVIGRAFDLMALTQHSLGLRLVRSARGGGEALAMPSPLAALALVAMLAGSVAAAYITWRLVEDPARRWSKRKAAGWGAGEAEARAPTI